MLNRDYFFEFAGMPKSGKSTVVDVICHFLKRKGFKISEYHGGGKYSPIDKSSIESLNIYLANKAIEYIIISSEREKVEHRLFIMDRGIFDRCIFTKALLKMSKIDINEATTINNYLTIQRLTSKIDGVYLFVTNPTLSIEREYKNKLLQKAGRVMNTKFLTILQETSLEVYQEKQKAFPNILLIDTQKLDNKITECAQLVADNILERIGVTDDRGSAQ